MCWQSWRLYRDACVLRDRAEAWLPRWRPWCGCCPGARSPWPRELTKLHEECRTGSAEELAAHYTAHPPRGEIVLRAGPPGAAEKPGEADIDAELLAADRRTPGLESGGAGCQEAWDGPQVALCAGDGTRGLSGVRKPNGRAGAAETIAAWHLRLGGWRIVAKRQRVGAAEADLVTRKARTAAFVEVKWRASAAALDQAIDARWLRRRAAEALAPRYAGPGRRCADRRDPVAPGHLAAPDCQ